MKKIDAKIVQNSRDKAQCSKKVSTPGNPTHLGNIFLTKGLNVFNFNAQQVSHNCCHSQYLNIMGIWEFAYFMHVIHNCDLKKFTKRLAVIL